MSVLWQAVEAGQRSEQNRVAVAVNSTEYSEREREREREFQ